jgi:uncharacterized protein YgiM (DUF1202 family)
MAASQPRRFPHFFSLSFAFSCSVFAAAAVALPPSAARATTVAPAKEDEGTDAFPQVENAKFHFAGIVKNNNVFVKSGPSLNSYSTMKLDKGAEVTVVGIKGEWLKIVPPEGSFSYVPQVYVTRRGPENSPTGRVNSQLNVRAGSTLNSMKTTIQTKLEEGADVKILGDLDEYYKIAPPEGAYVYINKQYVEPDHKLGDDKPGIASKTGDAGKKDEVAIGEKKTDEQPTTKNSTGDANGPSITRVPEPDQAPGGRGGHDEVAKGDESPTTKPAALTATEDFVKAEAEFAAASKLPTVEQPIEELTEKYKALAASGALGKTNSLIVDARLRALKYRAEARTELKKFAKGREELDKHRQAAAAEQGELEARVKQTQVSIYTAVGTLRVSSLQQGTAPLYRLTDPQSGKTVVYIRSNDPKYTSMLNQFVGVKGDLTNDERLKLKIITPTGMEAVDASKVNGTVIATITPPSMLNITTAGSDVHEAAPGN